MTATDQTQETIVPKFVEFKGNVRITQLEVFLNSNNFKLTLEVQRTNGSGYNKPKEITGHITYELANWFANAYPELVKVEDNSERGFTWKKTGNSTTGYLRFLKRRGLEFTPETLYGLTFESSNDSESFDENPFRLSMLKDRNILTLVNVAPKRRVQAFDIETGIMHTKYVAKEYIERNGRSVPKPLDITQFRRLIIENIEKVNAFVYK